MSGFRHALKKITLLVSLLVVAGCEADKSQSNQSPTGNNTADVTPTKTQGQQIQSNAASVGSATDHHYLHKREKLHAAEWGYTAGIGPNEWGDLCPDYVLAKKGVYQSPIDITDPIKLQLPKISVHYVPAKIDLVYNGHTIQETEAEGSFIEVDGKRYHLKQFHFHAPSEHTISGAHCDMEMHLVHQSDDGIVAVVAVMIVQGAENRAFDVIWDYLPTEVNKRLEYGATVDAATLLPRDRSYFQYMGSFTTPPCTQGVNWFVLRTSNELSSRQIEKFKSIIDGNNRPTQPLNGREVTQSSE